MAQYEIVLKDQTTAKAKSPIADNGGSGTTLDTQNVRNEVQGDSTLSMVGTYFAVKRVVSPYISQAINHEMSMIALSTGANESQQRIQFAYDIGRQAVGMAESIAIGGAVGGLPGAIGGAVTSLVTTMIGVAQRQDRINASQSLENVAINLMNARAGGSVATINGSRGR